MHDLPLVQTYRGERRCAELILNSYPALGLRATKSKSTHDSGYLRPNFSTMSLSKSNLSSRLRHPCVTRQQRNESAQQLHSCDTELSATAGQAHELRRRGLPSSIGGPPIC